MKSIRFKMTASLLAVIFVLMTVGMITTYTTVRSWMIAQFDNALFEKADSYLGMVKRRGGQVQFRPNHEYDADLWDKESEYSQIRTTSGKFLKRARFLEGEPLIWPQHEGPLPKLWNLRLPDGGHGRAVYIKVKPSSSKKRDERPDVFFRPFLEGDSGGRDGVEVMIVRRRDELDRNLYFLFWGTLAFSLSMFISIGLIVPVVVKSGLKPVRELAGHIKRVDVDSLDIRLSCDNIPDELESVSTNYNELLDRIEKGFQREKRMTADMAHELRTPIAELRACAEVSLKNPDDVEFALEALNDANQIAQQMEEVVSAMLTLARVEAGVVDVELGVFDLVELLRYQWEIRGNTAIKKSIRPILEVPSSLQVHSNEAMLACIVRNLLENAFEYCSEGGEVVCTIKETEKGGVLEVGNTNSTLASDDIPCLVEPFWRKQCSRSDENHSGLGLSVVQSLVRLLELQIEMELDADGFFVVKVFPFNK